MIWNGFNETHRVIMNKKCKKCGGTLYANTSVVLSSLLTQCTCCCENCGNFETYGCNELVFLSPTITVQTNTSVLLTCDHYYEVRVSNGQAVTYCTKCGKIGDSKNCFLSPTYTVTPKTWGKVEESDETIQSN